jgi:2-polyprenyl-3-methyl-5-hydroxy-6-metoxy-1,4-benzoquinol methylase
LLRPLVAERMLTDHSKTYRLTDVRNIAHIMRLKAILGTLAKRVRPGVRSYADFGCSNGFITSQVAERLRIPQAAGFDHSDNVEIGAQRYPSIRFSRLDLNVVHDNMPSYELVTCFETLEHVGNMESAAENVWRCRSPGGYLFVTVPIEIGWVGLLKYAVKRFLFRYDLPLNCTDGQYARALLKGERISRFRPPAAGYGTHFGFDYRDVDELLAARCGGKIEAWNSGTTRFYFVGPD